MKQRLLILLGCVIGVASLRAAEENDKEYSLS